MPRYFVYILFSASLNRYYIGFTNEDVKIRLDKHLAQHRGFTGKAKDWIIKLVESYDSKALAMKREKQLKSWKSAVRIRELIERSSTE